MSLLAIAPACVSENEDVKPTEYVEAIEDAIKQMQSQSEALGVKAGEEVPEHRRKNDAHGTVRVADYPAKGGFDEVRVYYIDKKRGRLSKSEALARSLAGGGG